MMATIQSANGVTDSLKNIFSSSIITEKKWNNLCIR
jgi:hypothetical protein